MLNKGTITRVGHGNRTQILASVEMQSSVGCIVDSALGAVVDGRRIVPAGTPLTVDLEDREGTPAVLATGASAMNAVLLHDVDVTDGDANGTALLFGFVNLNRIDDATVALITTASGNAAASPLLTFLRA